MARGAPRILTAAVTSLGIAGLMVSTACYAYDVKAPSDLMAGQHIEVTVNNLGRVLLASDLGEDVATVEGDVATISDSALRVRVTKVTYVNGTASPYPGSEIGVPRTTITTVSTKQFSRTKTTVAAIGLAAALVAGISAFGLGGIGGASSEPKPGGGPVAQ